MGKKLENHKILLIIISLLIIKLGVYYYNDFQGYVDKETYNYYVDKFEKTRPTDAPYVLG